MSSTVKIAFGDLFSGPCDLVVLPCSTAGTITSSVANQLDMFELPGPPSGMALGVTDIQRLTGADNIAMFVAYSASVHRRTSSEEAIRGIGAALGEFASSERAVRRISAPLLGTGAGGLSSAQSARALKEGFLSTAPDGARLTIFVLRQSVFDRLQCSHDQPDATLVTERGQVSPEDSRKPDLGTPRVFISYTKTNEKHREWVRWLGVRLRGLGIDCRLDIWHLRPGMDVAQWMCNEIEQADRVLIICNDEFARRADGRLGGVGWETRLVQGVMLGDQSTNPDKFLPIVRTTDAQDGLPTFLRTSYYVHWPSGGADVDELTQSLVETIFRKFEEAPPIGQPPSYVLA